MITEKELDSIESRSKDPEVLRLVSELRMLRGTIDRIAEEYGLLNMAIEAADGIGSRLRAAVGKARNESACRRCGSYAHHQKYCTYQV